MSEPTEPAENAGYRTAVAEPTPQRRSRLGVRLFGLALVVASVVLATYLLVAYLAFESGRELQVQQETAARRQQLDRQIELLESRQRKSVAKSMAQGESYRARVHLVAGGERRPHDIVVLPVDGVTAEGGPSGPARV